MGKVKSATLKLHQLQLDQKNYRLGPQEAQRDAIQAMIADQGVKLVRLARDIIEMGGVSPGELVWVIPSGKRGQYIVEEGNRRVTALKLLENPSLAEGTSVARQFRRLSKAYAEDPIKELDARIFETRADVLPWKRRRHMIGGTGVGTERWKTLAKGRANRDIGLAAPRSLAVVDLLENDSDAWSEIAETLDSRWTTVDRVLNTGAFSKVLGIQIDPKTSRVTFENGDERAGKALLMRVLSAMAAPDFEFSEVETVEDREKFVGKFAQWSVKGAPSAQAGDDADPGASKSGADATEEPAKSAEGATAAKEEKSATDREQRADADAVRTTLAPPKGGRLLPVSGTRLGPLYGECRKIKVKGNENAAAFLLRVFIELSSEAYLQEKGVKIPPSLTKKQITKWDDYKVKLSDKILAVAHHIDPSGKAQVFQQARLAVKTESVGPYSIATLHGYFHNRHLLPDAASIRDTWDGWETYLRELHNALSRP